MGLVQGLARRMTLHLDKVVTAAPAFLAGGGEMGAAIRRFDWAATPLGLPDSWPRTLKTCLSILLASRQPMWVWWGPELINFYNDPYLSIIGGKHPEALGGDLASDPRAHRRRHAG